MDQVILLSLLVFQQLQLKQVQYMVSLYKKIQNYYHLNFYFIFYYLIIYQLTQFFWFVIFPYYHIL
jgi:hypothetical protein